MTIDECRECDYYVTDFGNIVLCTCATESAAARRAVETFWHDTIVVDCPLSPSMPRY